MRRRQPLLAVAYAGAVVAHILAASGQSQQCTWTVPAGKTAHLKAVHAIVDGVQRGTIRVWQYQSADDVAAPFASAGKRLVHEIPGLLGAYSLRLGLWGSFPAKTDIWASGFAATTATGMTVELEIIYEDTPA